MISQVQAIILAGGLGTRLRSVVSDLPKCMASIHGKPFISYLIKYLQSQGVNHFIFSVGYMHEVIAHFIRKEYPDLSYRFSIEEEPLGTGGAIKLACKNADAETVFVCNGDTLFKINGKAFIDFHHSHKALCSLALKPMQHFNRYGVVELNPDHSIKSFKEKQWYDAGLINGGAYALNRAQFVSEDLPNKFSFEKDYLETYFNKRKMYGIVQDEYFIDIGIPEDYERAQQELSG